MRKEVFFHDAIITGTAFLYYGRMNGTRLLAGALIIILTNGAMPGRVFAAPAAAPARGYVCTPDASGEGWHCEEDRGQRPAPRPKSQAPKLPAAATETADPATARPVPPPDPEAARAAASNAAPSNTAPSNTAPSNIDPLTGLSLDPADWFTPSSPRPTQADYAPVPDLAETLYVRDAADGFCPGRYVQRSFPHPTVADDADFPIEAEADALTSVIDVNAALSGNVLIEQGNRRLVAPRADVDYDSRVATFPEGVRMDQPGLVMQGDAATVHLNTKEADLADAQFLIVDARLRGRAATVNQDTDGDLLLADNRFTSCEPGNNGWSLSTDSLAIAKDEVFGTARGAVLRLKSVPVFYTPYLKFPVSDERVSGFLFPNLGYSDEDGVDVSIPYYLNLAPNYDATIIPRYMSERGAGAELEFRHMSGWQNTTLSGALLPEDDIYNGTLDRDDFDEAGGEAVLGSFDPADRWLGGINHEGRIGPVRTLIDYTAVSDRDYFSDLGSDLSLSARRELQRKAEIQYANERLFTRLWVQRFQRLDNVTVDDYQRLPELEMIYTTPLPGPFEFSLGAKVSEFDRDTDGLNGLAAVTGNRAHFEPRLRMPLAWPFGFLRLTGGYRHTSYDLEQDSAAGGLQLVDDNPDRNIGMGSVDGGLFFERDLNWFGNDLIQTLEPRVFYLYQEFDEQSNLPLFDTTRLTFGYTQLFRDNRFAGLDRIGDADQASVGITTRFISRNSGREHFRFSIGEIHYFDDRRVTLAGTPGVNDLRDSSALAAETSAQLGGPWRLTGNIVWDNYDERVLESGVGIQYRRDNRHIFNLGYRKRDDGTEEIEQSDVSLYWPLFERFALVGRWNFDLISGRTIEGFGGIEYNDCCLQVRLMARRFLDSPTATNFDEVEGDDGVFLQIVFKGLAGFGTKVESVLQRGVRGYRSPEQSDFFNN